MTILNAQNQIHELMRKGRDDSIFLYDYSKLIKNLQTIRSKLDWQSGYYDLAHNPNLTITKIIHDELDCHVMIPDASYLQYLDLIGIRHSKVIIAASSADGSIHSQDIFRDCVSLWLSVRYIKMVKGKKFAILSGGINYLWEALQNRNAFRPKYRIDVYSKNLGSLMEQITFCGPLCTPQDTLVFDYPTHSCEQNDIVCISGFDSPGYFKSPCHFISHDFPSEYMKRGEKFHALTKQRESFSQNKLLS